MNADRGNAKRRANDGEMHSGLTPFASAVRESEIFVPSFRPLSKRRAIGVSRRPAAPSAPASAFPTVAA